MLIIFYILKGAFLMLVIGHRGAGGYTPHNSRQSFSQAIAMGAHMLETDIRVTRDNIPVICHDPSISIGLIEELTWEELKTFPLSNGEFIPSLEEVLYLFGSKVAFNLEIKPIALEKIEPILHITKKFHIYKPLYSSESSDIVKEISNPSLETALLIENPLQPAEIIDELVNCQANTLNLYYPLVDPVITDLVKSHNFRLIIWTDFLSEIWDPVGLYKSALEYKPYGFITGKPDRLRYFLKDLKS